MNVFFTASFEGKQTNQASYDKIIHILRKYGCKVISLEVEKYEDLLGKDIVKSKPKNEVHYAYIKKGIMMADAVIIEASTAKFRLGYEAALAGVCHRPLLCLSKNRDYSEVIMQPKFYARQYNDIEELEEIIKKFIDDTKYKHLSVRLHGYITPEQKNFLEWYSRRENKNSSEVIRELLDKKISEVPEYYDQLLFDNKEN